MITTQEYFASGLIASVDRGIISTDDAHQVLVGDMKTVLGVEDSARVTVMACREDTAQKAQVHGPCSGVAIVGQGITSPCWLLAGGRTRHRLCPV